MLRLCLLLCIVSLAFVPTRGTPNLRVMPPAELVANSVIIARARVVDVDESDWADFRQVATLEFVDVIEGDFTLKRVQVAAGSLVAYTSDHYSKKEEWLVFLWHDAGFYRTVNYQYGQFKIENDVVRGWRNSENVASDKPYYSVREEVERLVTDMRTPSSPADAPAAVPPQAAGATKPPQRPAAQRPAARKPQVIRPDRP